MKNLLLSFLILIFAGSFTACSDDSNKKKSDPVEQIIDNSIITLPSCISSEAAASKSVGTSKSAGAAVNEIYDGIRDNVGAIDNWTRTIKSILLDINRLTGFSSSGEWSDNSAAAGDPIRVVWGPSTLDGYTTQVDLYWSDFQTKGFEALVTINTEDRTAKGIITWDFHYVDDADDANNELVAQFIFDSTTEPKTLEIKATGLDNAALPKEPDNAWVKATLDADHVFTLGGNYYFPGIDLMNNGSAADRNYVFSVAGYDEEGMDADRVNRAILNLAVPPSGLSDITDMWTDDSIGAIFCGVIKTIWANASLTVTDIHNWTEIDLMSAATIDDLTAVQVIQILEWAALNDPTNADIVNFLFVLDLVNPAYYMETGFFGTWDGSRGTLGSASEIPAGFDDLNDYTVYVESPAYVRDLEVWFLGE